MRIWFIFLLVVGTAGPVSAFDLSSAIKILGASVLNTPKAPAIPSGLGLEVEESETDDLFAVPDQTPLETGQIASDLFWDGELKDPQSRDMLAGVALPSLEEGTPGAALARAAMAALKVGTPPENPPEASPDLPVEPDPDLPAASPSPSEPLTEPLSERNRSSLQPRPLRQSAERHVFHPVRSPSVARNGQSLREAFAARWQR